MEDQQSTGDDWAVNSADFFGNGGLPDTDFDIDFHQHGFELDLFIQDDTGNPDINNAPLITEDSMGNAVGDNGLENANPDVVTDEVVGITSHGTSHGSNNTGNDIVGVGNGPNTNAVPQKMPYAGLNHNAYFPHASGSEETAEFHQLLGQKPSFQAGLQVNMVEDDQSSVPAHSMPQLLQQTMPGFRLGMFQPPAPLGQSTDHLNNGQYALRRCNHTSDDTLGGNPHMPTSMPWDLNQEGENVAWLPTESYPVSQQSGGHMAFSELYVSYVRGKPG
ncbi:hypothetical protein VUR80DRAFT_840 [Thermomyces stellatus]